MTPSIDTFLTTWISYFTKVHAGLNLISGFPKDQLENYHPGNELSFLQRLTRQKEWLQYFASTEVYTSTLTLPVVEFIRRFFQHVLPKGFYKIRYFGFLSLSTAKELVGLVFRLLEKQQFLPVSKD